MTATNDITIDGDVVYEAGERLLRIPDPAQRGRFVADYLAAPDDQRVATYNSWRDRLSESAGVVPVPKPACRPGCSAAAYSKRLLVPKRSSDGLLETVPVRHMGIEVSLGEGKSLRFPFDGSTFGDPRESAMKVKERLSPNGMARLLSNWVGGEQAWSVVNSLL